MRQLVDWCASGRQHPTTADIREAFLDPADTDARPSQPEVPMAVVTEQGAEGEETYAWNIVVRPRDIERWRGIAAETVMKLGGDLDAVILTRLGVSELLANVCKHVGGTCRLSVSRVGDRAVIRVFDRSPVLPAVRVPNWNEESGRGLWLLREMCPLFGWETVAPHLGAKCVWFACWLTKESQR
ncbi:ATP-binding protein [Streptomyces hainanensis]|uniref:ATP-binding protein n=1 Tax=Streptomyces hainanensis TaxID=402648 RepID=A0A4R4TGL6_9ACTN|nr:ATP-binding protein [Streptomyces hainanensis]TDC75436.1 ATP-binding protein [Streptomyces hainanensis]